MESKINKMFSRIHNNYDVMNHLLSLNVDKEWRRKTAEMAMLDKNNYSVLDVATGTGDLAMEIRRSGSLRRKELSIVGSDFNREMLSIASRKARTLGMKNIKFRVSNALKLNNPDRSFDVLVSGFALRSLVYSKGGWNNMRIFAKESNRVLRKGGRLVLLDMALPDEEFQRAFFKAYGVFMKVIGSFVDKDAYSWLVDTINTFDKKRLAAIVRESGFRNVRLTNLKSGVAFVLTAEKG
jgi:demethylmenaquinone methyltransferase / 2-methoxy-6-polyprenyl-1,4-benzoquinol methylase